MYVQYKTTLTSNDIIPLETAYDPVTSLNEKFQVYTNRSKETNNNIHEEEYNI